MRYALNENNDKIEPEYSGQRALCPGCKKEVTGKIYNNRKNHWAHLKRDCDNWYEPISDWHIYWQNIFPKQNQEITLFDETNNEYHRADIMLDNGLVIEAQNSPIIIKEVSQRENFYNKKGLIWILNAKNLIPKSSFVNFFKPDICRVQISFKSKYYSRFEAKDIIEALLEREYHALSFSKMVGTNDLIEYIFTDKSIVNPDFTQDLIRMSIDSLNWRYSRDNYEKKSRFEVKITNSNEKYTFHKFLARNQWKKFIDEIKSPVFLDNVTDLDSDYLFWVQKNKIIKKKIH